MFICLELWQKHKPLLTKTYLYSWKFSCKYCNNKYVAIYSRTFLKFIYSEKATKFCGILTLLLTAVHTVKSKAKISQNFVAFSEYMDFKNILENLSFVVCWGVGGWWILNNSLEVVREDMCIFRSFINLNLSIRLSILLENLMVIFINKEKINYNWLRFYCFYFSELPNSYGGMDCRLSDICFFRSYWIWCFTESNELY